MQSGIELELFKAGLAVLVASITLLIGSTLGKQLTRGWDEKRRRREIDLAALNRFYVLYGEFFAVWKLWSTANPRPGEQRIEPPRQTSWALLERACDVEGGFEALLVKVCMERNLTDSQLRTLQRFRLAYQGLRQAIRAGDRLEWRAGPEDGLPAAKYGAFKTLAAEFAELLMSHDHGDSLACRSGDTLISVTSSPTSLHDDWWALATPPERP